MMKRRIIYIIRCVSLLFISGLILTSSLYAKSPLPANKCKKIRVEKLKVVKLVPKPTPPPFSFYNDVVIPLFPALKI